MKYLLWIVLLVAIIGGGWYATKNTTEQTVPEAVVEESMTTEGADIPTVNVVVEGSNFSFSEKEIRVAEGTKVVVTFSNVGGTHDFVIDEFGARTQVIQEGQSETIEFIADKKGTFEYYCSVGTHRERGMVGNLIVE